MTMNQTQVILFDGICNLCCGWVKFLLNKDKSSKFLFASLQSQSGIRLLRSSGIIDQKMESVVYLRGNEAFRESTAMLEILKDLGGIWKLFVILKLIPLPVRNEIYQFIAKRRYRLFGKRATCLLPTTENKKRFIT